MIRKIIITAPTEAIIFQFQNGIRRHVIRAIISNNASLDFFLKKRLNTFEFNLCRPK